MARDLAAGGRQVWFTLFLAPDTSILVVEAAESRPGHQLVAGVAARPDVISQVLVADELICCDQVALVEWETMAFGGF